MIAAAYARVSTTDQDNALQIAELKRYARAKRWAVEVFQDQISGAKTDRPGLNAVMDAARRGLVDVVLVWKLDRFGRSTTDILTNLQELEANGVRFIATTQGLDTDKSSPISRYLFTILAAAAELERELICERVRAGILRAKARGVKFGAPKKVFDRSRAAEMREAGKGFRHIAAALGVGLGTVHRLLAAVPEVPAKTRPADSCKQKGNRGGVRRSKG